MERLGLAVLGVGEMGKQHAENLRHLVPGARLVAVADVDRERARRVAAELEIEHSYGSVAALVERADVAAVVIASPDRFHAAAVQIAAAAGKHILCEKPLAMSLTECRGALDAVARAGVCLQIGFMRRYDPAYAAAKARIEAGEIGEPIIFKAVGRDRDAPPLGRYQTKLNGTLYFNSTIHEFDLARWLMSDEVAEVHSYATVRGRPEVGEYGDVVAGVVNLRFRNGAIGNTESYVQSQYGYDIRTEIIGTKGTLMVGGLAGTPTVLLTRGGSQRDIVGHYLVRFAEAYVLEIRDFVETVRAGRTPRVTGEDGWRAVAVAEAAVESYRRAQPAAVSQQLT